MNWYEVINIEEIDTPALFVFPDRIAANIEAALSMVGDPGRLRPHIKTHKSKEAAQMMIDEGITKFKCATIAEAEILGSLNAQDVLLAYQPVGPKIKRFLRLQIQFPGTRFSCLVDNSQAASALSDEALSSESRIEVFLDIDTGMHRTGIEPEQAEDLFLFCIACKGLTVRGLHAYDGHIRDLDLNERQQKSDQAYDTVLKLKNKLSEHSGNTLNIICGGSPTFPTHAHRLNVECSPGTFIYWDKGYTDLYDGKSFKPAAVIATRVISISSKNTITCDLGHKSIAAENDLKHRIHFLNANDLIPVGQSEEHLVLQINPDQKFQIGDVLYGLPHHICPTVALYEKVLPVISHKAVGEWRNIARDRKITI
ncbi:MAG: D-TA family PLP-dependent enzyme [Saprospiraceae bacterium]